ncbi:MAG: hypothetical protein H0V70_25845 [Ktedonobacteraceae bacterium]|nr:hypothetical protein [Ktedonobacteraceae bacterium]
MLRQIFTNDVSTIKRHILNHRQGNGPVVVARIAGWQGIPQVYDVREESSIGPSQQQQERRFLQGLLPLPSPQKRLEVQLHPHGGQPWHIAQTLYLKVEGE